MAAEIRSQITSHQASPGDFVILFRTNEQTRSFETELRRIGLKYVVLGGMSFFDRKEVRDILAYLRVVANPADEPALLRLTDYLPMAGGLPATIEGQCVGAIGVSGGTAAEDERVAAAGLEALAAAPRALLGIV